MNEQKFFLNGKLVDLSDLKLSQCKTFGSVQVCRTKHNKIQIKSDESVEIRNYPKSDFAQFDFDINGKGTRMDLKGLKVKGDIVITNRST